MSQITQVKSTLRKQRVKSILATIFIASGGGGSGSVTSVGDFSPLFTVTSRTTTPTFVAVNQSPNLFYAGPASGAAAAPTFRAMVAADLIAPLVNNASQGYSVDGTWTAGADLDFHFNFKGTFTARGTVSETLLGYKFTPTMIAGANNQTLSAVAIEPTFTVGAFTGTSNISLDLRKSGVGRFRGATNTTWVDVGYGIGGAGGGNAFVVNHSLSAGFEFQQVGVARISYSNIQTFSTNLFYVSSASNVSVGSSTIDTAKLWISQAALSSAHIPVFRSDPGAHTAITTTAELIANDFRGANFTWAAGTIATQRFTYFRAFTVTTGLATNAYTVYIDPPTGNITSAYTLGLAGNAKFISNAPTLIFQSANDQPSSIRFFTSSAAQVASMGYNYSSNDLQHLSTTTHTFYNGNGATTWLIISATAVTLADGMNFVINATTGTKFATATSQKLSFWNATPIIQPASGNQAALTDSTTGTPSFTLVDVGIAFSQANVNNNFSSLYRVINEMRNVLVNTGLMKGAA